MKLTCRYSLDLGMAFFLGDWLKPLALYLLGQLLYGNGQDRHAQQSRWSGPELDR